MRKFALLSALLPLILLAACGGSETEVASAEAEVSDAHISQIHVDFEESADPYADLQTAIDMAQDEEKYILLDVGGEWCSWCHLIDAYIETNAPTREAFACAFVILKVNYSEDNPNEEFLSQYPERQGYPHFFVLDSEGEFVASQGTGDLEEGRGYNEAAMVGFAEPYCQDA